MYMLARRRVRREAHALPREACPVQERQMALKSGRGVWVALRRAL